MIKLKDLLNEGSKVHFEKKGDDADISDFLGKGRQSIRGYKLIAKDGKYTLEYDERSGNIRLLYNGKQISDGSYSYTIGGGIDMEHPSWRVKNNYEKNFKTAKDIFNYFKSNKITTENYIKPKVNEVRDTTEIIEKIAKLTDRNDHTTAVIELATFLNNTKALKLLQAIETIHKIEGSIPMEVSKYRTSILKDLEDKFKSKYGPDAAKELNGAF